MAAIAVNGSSGAHATGSVVPAPNRGPFGHRSDGVRVFREDPDLLAGLDASTAERLSHRAVAPRVWIDPGPWRPPPATQRTRQSLGLLVIDGLLMRTLEVHGRRCHEIVGSGDLLRPWDDVDSSLTEATAWRALDRASLAILDERFAAIAGRWPTITAQLLARSIQRSRSLAINLAIVRERRADLRLRMLLWHLADRWGRVTPDGVHLPLRLTHEILGDLACIRRPTASSALNALARDNQIARRPDGTWLLAGTPPQTAHDPDQSPPNATAYVR
jgi:CRP/FNR family transcriptional regulator, cyclic AMP receptor protein